MKRTVKIIAMLLSAIMLIAAFAACAKPDNNGDTTTTDAAATNAPETTSGEIQDDLPESLKINDSVTFLYWEDVERPEFFVEESKDDGNIVNTRITERNQKVQERLGVELKWIGTKGNYSNQKNFVETANNSVVSGGGYDVFCGYSMTAATLAMNGLTQNLLDLKYITFEKPWWPSSLTDTATVNGKLYFTSGDISTNMLYMMYATFFNKGMLVEEHPDMTVSDLYNTVKNGQWTIDKLIELCQNVYRDENANGTADYEDRYGFESIDLHFDCFYIGSDLQFLEKNDDGTLKLSDDVKSDKTMSLLEKLTDFFYNSGFAFTKGTTSKYSSAKAFSEGRALFVVDRVYIASGTLKDVSDFKYGMLPVPKYNEEQSDYRTCMAFPFTLYSISVKAKDADAAAATLECLASEGYRRVTPALFEQSMKVRYSDELEDSLMYDTIKRTVVMDLSRIFTTPLQNMSYQPFRNTLRDNTAAGWSRKVSTFNNVLKSSLEKINDTFAK